MCNDVSRIVGRTGWRKLQAARRGKSEPVCLSRSPAIEWRRGRYDIEARVRTDRHRRNLLTAEGIEITKALNAPVLMLVFFGKCQVLQRPELDRTIAVLKELAPEAERAGIILGFENTSSGADNRYALDQVKSKAFKVWYDVGNSTFNGYDVPAEIRALG